jgi:hypothetical protein
MIKAEIYEVEYSISPGGKDVWEIDISDYGNSRNVDGFNTAGDALNYLISQYPEKDFELYISPLSAYHKNMERENA